jgi:hypothetical protein
VVPPEKTSRLTKNKTPFNVKASGPGVIVLTEAYVSHAFKLRLNGKPAHYFCVNSAFRGISSQKPETIASPLSNGPATSRFCW